MRPIRLLGVVLTLLLMLAAPIGCGGGHTLRARVIAGSFSEMYVAAADGALPEGAAIEGARITVIRDPDSLGREEVARGRSDRAGVATIRIDAFGAGYADQKGQPRPWQYALANRLVFSKVREKLGMTETRFAVASAAPLAQETQEFFLSLGIPILDIWGMSELTGPATISLPSCYRTGRAGRVLPGSEMKIASDGELLVRGPHVFKGYYKNEAVTRETIDDEGWLHSGDVAEFDDEGFLRITDRKKELIITAGGKNIAPQFLEGKLKQIPAISQAVAVGDRRPYVVALLAIDPTRVTEEAEKAGSPAKTPEEAAVCPAFKAWVEKQVEETNRGLARYEQIKKFALLPNELTTDADELTPTMKLKRRVIHEKYGQAIDSLYA